MKIAAILIFGAIIVASGAGSAMAGTCTPTVACPSGAVCPGSVCAGVDICEGCCGAICLGWYYSIFSDYKFDSGPWIPAEVCFGCSPVWTDVGEDHDIYVKLTYWDLRTEEFTSTVTVVGVGSVNAEPVFADKCKGESITFTATSTPGNKPLGCILWQRRHKTAAPGSTWSEWMDVSGNSSSQILNTTSDAGYYQYRARNGSNDVWKESVVVHYCSWSSAPEINILGIKKAHDQEWFHISQSCDLTIEAIDEDSHCGNLPDGGNHIKEEECMWFGYNLSRYNGISVKWEPDSWTTGNTIYVVVDDDPCSPGGLCSDDSAKQTPSVTMKAWEVQVHFTAQSTANTTTETKVLSESGYGDTVEFAYVECSLAKGPVTAATTKTGSGSDMVVHNDGPHQFGAAEANATWSMGIVPQGAITYSASGKCKVSATMSGVLTTQTEDDDWDILPSDYVNVSIGSSLGGIGVDIGTEINIAENCESCAGIGFGFASDVLSDCLDDVYKIEDNSSKSNPSPVSYSHSDTQWFRGAFGFSKGAQAKIDGKVEAKGYVEVTLIPDHLPYYNDKTSSASISSTGSCTYKCSDLGAEILYFSTDSVLIH